MRRRKVVIATNQKDSSPAPVWDIECKDVSHSQLSHHQYGYVDSILALHLTLLRD